MIEFADNLPLDEKKGNGRIAVRLVDFLSDKLFEVNIFRRFIESFTDSEEVTAENTEKLMKIGRYHITVIRSCNGKTDDCDEIYVKQVTKPY